MLATFSGTTQADCVCAVCRFPPAKRRRGTMTIVPIISAEQLCDDASEAELTLSPILFIAERLPHIRCYCLSLCGDQSATLKAVEVTVGDDSISLHCRYGSAQGGEATCSLRLDLGEALDRHTRVTVTVQDGYAYVRLPLAPEAARCEGRLEGGDSTATRALDDGRVSQQLREEAGLYHRAAAQRRRERGALDSAWISCRKCHGVEQPPLIQVAEGRSLPDVDMSSLVDFMQCCEEINFDWRCVFPPVESQRRASQDGDVGDGPRAHLAAEPTCDEPSLPICFLGTHALHMRAQPLSSDVVQVVRSEAFSEAPCYRHTAGPIGVGVWAPIRCTRCSTTLGAARVGSATPSSATTIVANSPIPAWFDSDAPPECGCTVQFLKSAVVSRRAELGGARSGSVTSRLFDGYSMAALIADRILRVAEDEAGEHTRQFAISATDDVAVLPELAIFLLSPYVTLATNQPSHAACDSLTGAAGGGGVGAVVDALKVLYTTEPSALAAACGNAHRLILPEKEERARVMEALQRSTTMLAPSARAVGAMRVGFLPVAPTWD